MTDRLMIAYGLMLLMALAAAGAVWWNVYHSHERTLARRRARQRQSERPAPPSPPAPS